MTNTPPRGMGAVLLVGLPILGLQLGVALAPAILSAWVLLRSGWHWGWKVASAGILLPMALWMLALVLAGVVLLIARLRPLKADRRDGVVAHFGDVIVHQKAEESLAPEG